MPLQHVNADDQRLLQDVADSLAASHKMILVTGAGISTSCGIPDFRSKDGLYSLIQQQRTSSQASTDPPTPSKKQKFSTFEDEDAPASSQQSVSSTNSKSSGGGHIKGKDLFDARVWKDPVSTSTFYTFIASLRKQIHDEVKQTSQTHRFIRVLRDGGRLMRCYTQNIDGLEEREGLTSDLSKGKGNKRRFMRKMYESPRPAQVEKNSDYDGGCEVVPLHGDLKKLRCNLCQTLADWTEADTELFLDGTAPHCQTCSSKAQNRRESGKRGLSIGLLRPNIVLYQEQHPSEQLLAPLPPFDMAQGPDILLIMGTSLKVHGLQNLVREFAKAVHARKNGRVVFVNRTKPSESIWNDFIDDWVSMDCDDWILDLRARREDIWLRQGELDLKTTKAGNSRPRKRKSSSSSSSPLTPPHHDQEPKPMIDATKDLNITREIKRSRKSKTPTSPPADGLPTPPPSNSKRKRNHKSSSKPDQKSRTTCTDDLANILSAQRGYPETHKTSTGVVEMQAISPITSPTPKKSHTPWTAIECKNTEVRRRFLVYEDSPPTDISPIKERVELLPTLGVLCPRPDTNTLPGPLPIDRSGLEKSNTIPLVPSARPRRGLSISDLLN